MDKIREDLIKGLEESANGEVSYLGSFAEYAEELD